MVLVTLRASVDGQVLQQVARVVVGEVAIKEPIDLFLSDFDKVFKLRSVHVHSDATWGKPFTDLDLETLDAISAGELAEIGKFLDLVGEARAEPSAATTQKSAFDELKTKLVLPLRSTVDRFDWLIYNALLDRLAADGLGFPPDLIKEGGCGKRLLLALKAQLNYVLPYDSRGVFSARSCHIPERFKLSTLGVQKADRRGGDEDQHHGAKETEARLSTEKLINLNNATYDTLERLEADQKTAKWKMASPRSLSNSSSSSSRPTCRALRSRPA